MKVFYHLSIIKTMRSVFLLLFLLLTLTISPFPAKKKKKNLHTTTQKVHSGTKTTCMALDKTLRAHHRTCFLRPDTGPCRADIVQWYFDVRMRQCYRFFWGGCQGNGNRFETNEKCRAYCRLNTADPPKKIPFYCDLAFDFGSCFGAYNRWTFDKLTQSCRRRLYSGCGGNQNNFETRRECQNTCLNAPNSTFNNINSFNICIPFNFDELN